MLRLAKLIASTQQELDVYRNRGKPQLSDKDEELRLNCEASFYEFVKHAWVHLEGREYIDGWHCQAISEHLQAMQQMEIRDLLINLPPRVGKSLIVGALFPAWCWTVEPELRFLYTSYAQHLSVRDAVACRRLITSSWYENLWGFKFTLMGDVNNKLRFDNSRHGYRLASSVGGTITGQGGDIICCFPYDVLVTTDKGQIAIGDIVEQQIECNILSYNHQNNKIEYKPILEYMHNHSEELIEIDFEDGSVLKCTEDHPVYVNGKGYVHAEKLTEKDFLLALNKMTKTVKSIRRIKSSQSVYNLNVADNHNYFANKVLVHNCDDPNSITDVHSEVIRTSVNDWWDYVMSTRFCNAATGRRLLVQQRCHANDLSGHILAKDDPSWIVLCLPMSFEKSRRAVTVPLPMSNGKVWMDPRKNEGDLLWPEGINEVAVEKIKKNFNYDSYVIASQLQQRPSPAEGGILKEEWFKPWKQKDLPDFQYILQSWDTALTSNKMSCYSACTTWGVFKDKGGINNIMLLSLFREKIEYPDLRKAATRLAYNYEDVYFDDPIDGPRHLPPDLILIEAKVSGYSLLADLMRANLSVMAFNPGKYGDKIGRCRIVSHLMENGLVWLPTVHPKHEYYTEDSQMFLEAAITFPNTESNDIIDSMSQAFIRLTSTGWITNKEDPVDVWEPNWKQIDKPYH